MKLIVTASFELSGRDAWRGKSQSSPIKAAIWDALWNGVIQANAFLAAENKKVKLKLVSTEIAE